MYNPAIHPHRWTRHAYDRMILNGIFHPEARLELLNGEIIDMSPQGSFHSTSVILATEMLRSSFSKGYVTRVQMPLALAPDSEPEPDIAVVPGSPRDYRDEHPDSAVLVVEVSDTTLSFDRNDKKKLYALSGIPEYWIINLTDGHLEVYRNPVRGTYNYVEILGLGKTVSPIAAPDSLIAVADILP